MRSEKEIIVDINKLHELERNVDNAIPQQYNGRFSDAPSVWHANTRLATELALVREPHILDDPKASLQFINS